MKREVIKIFEDLEEYHDFCRTYGRVYNERHLYKENTPYSDFLNWKETGRALWYPNRITTNHRRKR